MSVINTNITSMIGQQNLSKSQNALQTSMERLSSGLRINSAKDDAAGQAIANRMTAQITGLAQAQRNANDGISIAQTAEGSLNQVNDNLQRIRELTVQAQNGTNSQNDLGSIQDEINQRLEEIDRISRETDFNGVSVLASDNDLKIQVGANDGQTITVGLQEITASTLGMDGFSVSGNSLNVSEAITQVADGANAPSDVDLSAVATTLGVDASTLSLRNTLDADGNATNQYVVKSGDDFYAASVDDTDGSVVLNVADVDFTDPESGVTANVTLSDQLVKVGADEAGAATAYVEVQGGNYAIPAGALANGVATPTDFDNTGAGNEIILSGAAATAEFAGASTNDPMALIDEALNKVDSLRSELGAVQNRFGDAINNLSTNETNLSAARSRIEDADYAVEVADMTRAQILQQAGTSVLAQANQIPQNVLSLLG
ncbi:FliC/FljB family flagellin [Halomonas meridiana]|uniref:FliC/FljB family flagellin n=1 Tax=Vreelandella aquamarina TaxID=77097 RepID=UPI00273B8A1D|nr:FliC/FljB family flagellin [Halomonas meridiana]MDP4558586.1 FliC/FljB family flagellin [Halomonas meridiana]